MWIDDDKVESIKKMADIVELFDMLSDKHPTLFIYKEIRESAAIELKKMLED